MRNCQQSFLSKGKISIREEIHVLCVSSLLDCMTVHVDSRFECNYSATVTYFWHEYTSRKAT